MAVKINFNEAAAQTHTSLIRNERFMNKSLLRLSTGMRILNAADDSAGLFIADMLSTVAKAYEQGNRNIQTGISALQIAEASAGQIFDKLQEIYVRAQNAANDINDPNARNALQSEILNFVDAIQKIGTDTEYNGIKLLDGSFKSKYIHYGPRMDQTVLININSLKAQDLGAFIAQGAGQTVSTTASTTDNFSTWSATTNAIYVGAGDYFKVSGFEVTPNTGTLVDAYAIAQNINNNSTLKSQGIEAKAVNISSATADFSSAAKITYIGASTTSAATVNLTLDFYVGNSLTSKFSISASTTFSGTAGLTSYLFSNLEDLVTQINTQAAHSAAPITARSVDGKLVLETTNGETIAISAKLETSNMTDATINANINLDQIIQGASQVTISTTSSETNYAHAVKVGNLTIAGVDNFTVDQSGLNGLNGLDTDITKVKRENLYSIDVTDNLKAERALLIITKALQKVDKERSQIGATMNNLQSIFDSQKVAYDNTKEAESVIRNTDYAKEMADFTTYQIRMQATVAMLAQANTLPQLVLQLMR